MPRAPFHLDAIKAALAANGEMRAADLARAVDISDGTLMAAVVPGMRDGVLVKRKDGNATFYSLADGVEVEPAAEPESRPFYATLDTDGELDLYGLIELQDGGHRVTPDGVRLLCRLLHGQGPEE